MKKTNKDVESKNDINLKDITKNVIINALASLLSALISTIFSASDKNSNTFLTVLFVSFISLSVITFSITFTWVNINKKSLKVKNKGGEITNSPQTFGSENYIDNRTYNYNFFPNKDTITSPEVKKDQEEKIIKQFPVKRKGKLEKNQEISQQEFEELLMKVKFIAFGIMGNIKWEKVKPLEFWKEEGKELVKLEFEIEKKLCSIEYIISEEDKQRFLKKTSTFEIVERFITLHLVSCGRNNYFDDKCPECKQTTLTSSLIINSPDHEEAISCSLCDWVGSMVIYKEYLNDKKSNPSLEFPEWFKKK